MRNPAEYVDLPVEQWPLRELTAALGNKKTADLLDLKPGNVRVLRHRNSTSLERMQTLQDAIREDYPAIRSKLFTLYTVHTTRTRRPTKESTHA